MPIGDTIHKHAFDALSEFMRDRMCLVDAGTGNILSIGGRYFIATCYHVAHEFFSNKDYEFITLRRNDRIPKSKLKLFAYKNDELDVALIEVLQPITNYPTYALSDFEVVDPFTAENLQLSNIMISGTPGELAKNKSQGTFYTPVTFLTLPLDAKLPSSDYLFCKYPTDEFLNENKFGGKIKLPAAPGFSGAFMLKVTQFRGQSETIWIPGMARVVAIQHRWDQRSYIKGTSIKHLLDLLPR